MFLLYQLRTEKLQGKPNGIDILYPANEPTLHTGYEYYWKWIQEMDMPEGHLAMTKELQMVKMKRLVNIKVHRRESMITYSTWCI